MSKLVWERHGISLTWRDDEFGKPEQALYLGNIYVGHVMNSTAQYPDAPWRAWFMSDEDGGQVGWFASKQEAMDAVTDRVLKEMFAS